MRVRRILLASMAVAAVLIVLNSDWLYSSLYFYAQPQWQIYLTALLPVLFVFALATIAARLIGDRPTIQALDLAALVGVAFLVYDICKRNGLLHGGMPVVVKLMAVVAVLLAAFLVVRLVPNDRLVRLNVATVAGCALFLFAPELASPFQSNASIKLVPMLQGYGVAPNTNVAVLVLDELSYLDGAPVESALRASGHIVYAKGVESSGKRTDSAIPALLTGVDMDGDRACSATTLCSSAGLFNMADQKVGLKGFNIVGFYHPYCELRGLTYCRQISVFGQSSILVGYGCGLFAALAPSRRPEQCERGWLNAERATHARQEIRNAVYRAPFWHDGGFLYVHILLPHPPAAAAGTTLDEDYAANLQRAADFSVELANALRLRFAANFLLVITSDHPLRPTVWCSMYRYRRPGCSESRKFTATQVPLIATGRKAETVMQVENNYSLLSSLPIG
jgi:hypothetical protein